MISSSNMKDNFGATRVGVWGALWVQAPGFKNLNDPSVCFALPNFLAREGAARLYKALWYEVWYKVQKGQRKFDPPEQDMATQVQRLANINWHFNTSTHIHVLKYI